MANVLTNFLNGVKGVIERDKINSNLDNNIRVLLDLIGQYQQAIPLIDEGTKYKNEINELNESFNLTITAKINKKNNLVSNVYSYLSTLLINLNKTQKLLDEILPTSFVGDGLQSNKIAVLQIVSYSDFAINYAIKLLNYIYVIQTPDKVLSHEINKATLKWLILNIANFGIVLNVLGDKSIDIIHEMKNLPVVIVSSADQETTNSVYGNSISLFKVPLSSSFRYNPLYTIGMLVGEWEANSYKVKKDQLEVLKLRKLELENEPTHTSEAQIDVLNMKIAKLETAIERTEEDYELR